jgi:hypothetical protein
MYLSWEGDKRKSQTFCVRQLSVAVMKHLRKSTYRRKGWFWLMVSVVSGPGHLTLLFLGHDEAEHHGRNPMVEGSCSPHAGTGRRCALPATSPVTYFYQWSPS